MRGRSCLTNRIRFREEMIKMIHEVGAVKIVHMVLSTQKIGEVWIAWKVVKGYSRMGGQTQDEHIK